MNIDWKKTLRLLQSYPEHIHRILPPCPDERIAETEHEYGVMPGTIKTMLNIFNGAELFINYIPLVTLFGISISPIRNPLEWAPEWYIDKYTSTWRLSRDHHNEWPVAMNNYGGLIILDSAGMASEWDTNRNVWGRQGIYLSTWIEEIIHEGDLYIHE